MLKKYYSEFLAAMRKGHYTETSEGVLIKNSVRARGKYYALIDGELQLIGSNLMPTEGLNYFLESGLNKNTPATNFYLALFSGAVTPMANWTAANFAANATEITSTTEGYSNATRPVWTPGAVANGVADNIGSLTVYNIVCSTSINISGGAILTDNARGGTSGLLLSAARFDQVNTVNNGATFQVGYELELSDS